MAKVLSIQEISKEFGGNIVVDNVSFDLYEGEILGVLGPNGAGKTTTIRSIMDIIRPDSGTIEFYFNGGSDGGSDSDGNIDNRRESILSRIGYLPEERGLYRDVKVIDMLLYLARLKGYPEKRARERILNYLDKFKLNGREKAKISELSKGMAQKVQFIASVLHEPDLLILDEPLSGLDPVSQEVFRSEIRDLADGGTAILLSSHQMDLVENVADRIFMMNKGQRVLYGELARIKEDFGSFKCEIIGDNDGIPFSKLDSIEKMKQDKNRTTIYLERGIDPNQFIRELPEGIHIQEINISRISLHEIFLKVATQANERIAYRSRNRKREDSEYGTI